MSTNSNEYTVRLFLCVCWNKYFTDCKQFYRIICFVRKKKIMTYLEVTSLIFKIFPAFCPQTIRSIIRELVINFKIPYNFQTSTLLLTYLYLSRVYKTMRFIGSEFMLQKERSWLILTEYCGISVVTLPQ